MLILDESSAALDLDSTERLFAKMRELRDEGSAVLIVTHRIAELIRISDRATVLRDGRDVGVLERGRDHRKESARADDRQAGRRAGAIPTAVAQRGAAPRRRHARRASSRSGREQATVDFALHRGEILGVAGLDGQGQDEFVRILAGVRPAAKAAAPRPRRATRASREIGNLRDAMRRTRSPTSPATASARASSPT